MIKFLLVFISLQGLIGFSMEAYGAPKISRSWSRSTLQHPHLAFRHNNRMAPILTEKLVIQGNAIDGIKAFDRQTGHEKWSLKFKNGVEGGAALSKGKLYFGAGNGQFYSVEANTGKVIWTFPLNSESVTSPLVVGEYVFHVTGNNNLYALDGATGRQIWLKTRSAKTTMTVRGQTSPAFSNGTIYVGFSDGTFAAYNAENGREMWSKRIGDDKKFNDVDATAKITDKCVLVASYANALYCLNKNTGTIVWRHDHGGFNSVAVKNNKVYYPTTRNEIHVLDANSGKHSKTIKVNGGLATELVAFKDWVVYGESNGSVIVRNAGSLEVLDRFTPGRGLIARPTVDPEKAEIYIHSNEANLFKLNLAEKSKSSFPWSM